MAATIHLVSGPVDSGSRAVLLQKYQSSSTASPGSALWLAPSIRAADQVRSLLGQQGWKGGFKPHIYSIEHLAETVIVTNDAKAQPLSHSGRRLLLEEILEELRREAQPGKLSRASETKGFAESLFSLIEELKQLEVWPAYWRKTVAQLTSRHTESTALAVLEALQQKADHCSIIYSRYQRFLVDHHRFDLEGRIWFAQQLLREGRRAPFQDVRSLFVDGFDRFTRSQEQLIAHFADFVTEVWVSFCDEPGDPRSETFHIPRSAKHRLEQRSGSEHTVHHTVEMPFRPHGLSHLQRSLFIPPRQITPASDASGISLLEAPGIAGEVKMVARRIKELLLQKESARNVLIVCRDIRPYADLIEEIFEEYGIPVDIEGVKPLSSEPSLAMLVKAVRLADEDWPFADLSALLRSTWFRPLWPETRSNPALPEQAEALLRFLGELRGRDAYLTAVRQWAIQPPEGLEDEQAEESRRRKAHELAKTCGPFLERLFALWDRRPSSAPLKEHIKWMWWLADQLGLREAFEAQRFQRELDQWLTLTSLSMGGGPIERRVFHRRLPLLLAEAGAARSPRGGCRARAMSAELARPLEAKIVFVLGLGERSFPQLIPDSTFFDEQERMLFRSGGVPLAGMADLMEQEMLLFYQTVTKPEKELILSYPAVDERGQDLLPGTFLRAVLELFEKDAIPKERRNLLIEGYATDKPLSPMEHRARIGLMIKEGIGTFDATEVEPGSEWENLLVAAEMAQKRLQSRDHSPYEGMLSSRTLISEVAHLFGPERVFSPTALEDYVACPFRFFLGHVLRLEPLKEPREEIAVTRRGQAVHRALARLHERLCQQGVLQPDEQVDQEVLLELRQAIEEDIERAPGLATKALWKLEGERLYRVAGRYREQWEEFIKPWKKVSVDPEPRFFEVDFGLPPDPNHPNGIIYEPLILSDGDLEVRISGRIDRVDTAPLEKETGFWIIDYKTGKSSHYSSTALLDFQRLQLTLYAMAVEEVLLADSKARPLGLVYWMVTEKGAKVVLPGRNQVLWLTETAKWQAIREQLQQWILTLVTCIRQGTFPLSPRSDQCTATCDFSQICRITQSRSVEKSWTLPLPVLP